MPIVGGGTDSRRRSMSADVTRAGRRAPGPKPLARLEAGAPARQLVGCRADVCCRQESFGGAMPIVSQGGRATESQGRIVSARGSMVDVRFDA